ncbi:MAG: PAS domain S-box protein, partial [Actinobacteria bacterium]|nr:PAS domain S-box protein [Actinomycetota bacterium]
MSTDAPATDVGQPTILDGDGAHHALILQTMAEGVVVQDRDGAIRSCNPGAERILGLTADQMTGRTSLDPRWRAVREDGSDFPGPEHPAMVTLATGQGLRDVIMGVHVPDGALRWISISTEPFIRGDGVLDGVVCSFTDITAVRLAELCARESAERLSAVLRVPAEVGIVGTDAAGLITLFSAGAERMLGYSAAELIGRHTPMLFHDPVELAARAANLGIDEPGLAVVTSATRAGRAETREWTHVRKNGDRFIASVNVSAIRSADDAIVGFVGMLIDVTEARCVERQRDAQARESASLRRVATAVARGQRPVEIFSLVAREAAE